MRKSIAVLLALAAAWTTAPANATKAATDAYRLVDTFTLRDAPDDVQQSDGLGPYPGADLAAYIRDYASVTVSDEPTETQDHMYARTHIDGSRKMFLNNDLAEFAEGSSGPIACLSSYAVFISDSTPNWYEALANVGAEVQGWGTTGCYTAADRGYHVFYDETRWHTGSGGECLRMTRVGTSSFKLVAPPGGATIPPEGIHPAVDGGDAVCNAHLASFVVTTDEDTGAKKKTFTSLGTTSAPLELLLAMRPPRGGAKK